MDQKDKENLNAQNQIGTQHSSSGDEVECFATRLTELLKGRSSRSFARAAGISETVMRKYLAGKSEPGRPALIALAREGGANVGWLATGEGPMLRADTPEPAPDSDSQDVRLDEAKLAEALTTIDQALALTRRSAPPQARARLAAMAYRILVEEASVSAALSRIMQAVDAAITGDTT